MARKKKRSKYVGDDGKGREFTTEDHERVAAQIAAARKVRVKTVYNRKRKHKNEGWEK